MLTGRQCKENSAAENWQPLFHLGLSSHGPAVRTGLCGTASIHGTFEAVNPPASQSTALQWMKQQGRCSNCNEVLSPGHKRRVVLSFPDSSRQYSAKLYFCLHAISLLVAEEPLRSALVLKKKTTHKYTGLPPTPGQTLQLQGTNIFASLCK